MGTKVLRPEQRELILLLQCCIRDLESGSYQLLKELPDWLEAIRDVAKSLVVFEEAKRKKKRGRKV